MNESNLVLDDGRTWRFYDQGPSKDGNLAVFWLHGTPNIGLPPEPLFADAARLGLRWLGYDRPGYGGSTSPRWGRWDLSAPCEGSEIDR